MSQLTARGGHLPVLGWVATLLGELEPGLDTITVKHRHVTAIVKHGHVDVSRFLYEELLATGYDSDPGHVAIACGTRIRPPAVVM
jgi:hypothetical protein